MKYKYIGIKKRYSHEKLGEIKLKAGDIIDDCSIVSNNKDCFVEIKEEKKQIIDEKPISANIKKDINKKNFRRKK